MKTGMAYPYRKFQFIPVCSASVEIPDDTDDDKAVLIAARQLMKDFKVELMFDEEDEIV